MRQTPPGERTNLSMSDPGGGMFKRFAILVMVAVVVVGVGWWINARRASERGLARMTGEQAGITLQEQPDGDLTSVSRDQSPDVYFRAVLLNAPIGKRLPLTCDWIDPAGRLLHQNQYETQEISRTAWPTHAHYRFGPSSPTGTWTVQLAHQSRTLVRKTFEVRDRAISQPTVEAP